MSSPSTATLPSDIVDYLREIDEADSRVTVLTSRLTEVQATWQPNGGARWSVAQCLEHIAKTNQTYLESLNAARSKARSGHTPFRTAGWFSSFFLKRVGPQVTLKIKAPKKITPQPHATKADAIGQYEQANDNLRRFVLETAQLDLCGARFNNPYVPGLNFTIATGLLIMAAHTRRHLNQAEQVLQAPAFPR
jgi:hypothetical protein